MLVLFVPRTVVHTEQWPDGCPLTFSFPFSALSPAQEIKHRLILVRPTDKPPDRPKIPPCTVSFCRTEGKPSVFTEREWGPIYASALFCRLSIHHNTVPYVSLQYFSSTCFNKVPGKFHPRKFHPRKFHPRKFHPRKFHPAKIPPT